MILQAVRFYAANNKRSYCAIAFSTVYRCSTYKISQFLSVQVLMDHLAFGAISIRT